jgi:hypothetical protein
MKLRQESSTTAASPAESVLQPSPIAERLQLLHTLRLCLEAEIVADRLPWRVRLCRLLSIYREIEDCSVTQALAPHQTVAPQDRPTGRKRDIAGQRAEATAA